MSSTTKNLTRDAGNIPAPQYYNEDTDAYEPLTGSDGSINVKITETALPSGAATAAKQDTGNASLSTIAGKDFATSAKQDTGNSSLATIAAKDFATTAKQDTGNTSIAAINTATGATTDTESSSGNGSVIAILKGIRTYVSSAIKTLGSAIGTKAHLIAGSDGTNAQAIKTTTDGTLLTQLTGSNLTEETGLWVRQSGTLIERETPVGFNWVNHDLVGKLFYNTLTNAFETTLDVADYDPHKNNPSPKIYYVAGATGSDSNDGLTKLTPLQTLKAAMQKADVDIVEIKQGTLYIQHATQTTGAAVTRDITIRPYSNEAGEVVISAALGITTAWTLTAGKTNTYQAARSIGKRVYDAKILDAYGDYSKLTLVGSIDTCESTAGSWYTDDTTVYVHLADNRVADSNVIIHSDRPLMLLNASVDITVYIENISFEGGRAFSMRSTATGAPTVYVKNVDVKYGITYNGSFDFLGARKVICQGCTEAKGEEDGFNYHSSNSVIPKAIEIDCSYRDNGLSDTDNGSTMHDGGKIIRVNTKAYRNTGPNIVDVNDGTQFWNLGTVGYKSSGALTQGADYFIGDGAVEGWYDRCTGYGSPYSLVVGDADAIVYIHEGHYGTESITGKKFTY